MQLTFEMEGQQLVPVICFQNKEFSAENNCLRLLTSHTAEFCFQLVIQYDVTFFKCIGFERIILCSGIQILK